MVEIFNTEKSYVEALETIVKVIEIAVDKFNFNVLTMHV